MKKQILLVDDHPLIRAGIAQMINHEDDMHVCCEAEDAEQALQALEKYKPDMAIVDITLKGTNGIDLIKQIKEIKKDFPILVLSMHQESLYAERALRAGAKGYIHKQENSENTRKAIRTVLSGQLYISDAVKARIVEKSISGHDSYEETPVELLSDREFEVFQLIGQGFKPQQIADELNLSVKTIENYRIHIREKLHLNSASDLTKQAIDWYRETKS